MQAPASASAEDTDSVVETRVASSQAPGPGMTAPTNAATSEDDDNIHSCRGRPIPKLGNMRSGQAGVEPMVTRVGRSSG